MKTKIQNSPLVSVVIPVFNAEKYLGASIQSILSQTFKNLEVIAIDDGSKDKSWSILKKLANKDHRLHIYRNKTNRNIAYTLNRTIKLAKGKYLARMDADDIALKTRLQKQIKYLKNHPSTVVVGSHCYTINEANKPLGQKRFPITNKDIQALWFLLNPMQHPTMMINRDLLPENFHWYNETLPPAEDLDLLFRLAKYGKLHNLNQRLLYYRLYPESETFKHPLKTYLATKKVRDLATNCYGYSKPLFIRLINLIQEVLIRLLPAQAIYFIYNNLRTITSSLSEKKSKRATTHPELNSYKDKVAYSN